MALDGRRFSEPKYAFADILIEMVSLGQRPGDLEFFDLKSYFLSAVSKKKVNGNGYPAPFRAVCRVCNYTNCSPSRREVFELVP